MAAIVCAISGETPREPVFCSRTGYIFEKRLIEKHLEAKGTCPLTNEQLVAADFSAIKCNKAVLPRPLSATSIPGMLTCFQSEWDAMVTESCKLKEHVETVREQLSHTLYQHDAACRVIARLMKQRDESRVQVTMLQQQLAAARAGAMEVSGEAEPQGIGPELLARMQEKSKVLAKGRKGRAFPDLNTKENLRQFAAKSSHANHQASAPGVLCLSVQEQKLATGGMDGNVALFDLGSKETVQKLKGHGKPVTAVQLHPTRNVVVSASQDHTARVWVSSSDNNWAAPHKCTYVSKIHKSVVSACAVHPIGDVFATSSTDKSWALHDLNVGRCIRHVDSQASGYNALSFHPDGLIVGCGSEEGLVQVWDLKAQVVAAELKGHTGALTSLMFSENGYYLATGSKDCSVKLWDLRKPICFQTITLDGKQAVNCVSFDASGQFLAISTDKVEVCNFEGKTSVAPTTTLADHAPGTAVTAVSFLPNAKKLVSCGMDRMVKIYE